MCKMEKTLARALSKKMEIGKSSNICDLKYLIQDEFHNYYLTEYNVGSRILSAMEKIVESGYATSKAEFEPVYLPHQVGNKFNSRYNHQWRLVQYFTRTK